MNTKNRKTIELHKFVHNLPQRLDLKNANQNMIYFKIYQFITRGKVSRKNIKTINSKHQLQYEMVNLNYLMVLSDDQD